MIGEVCPTIKTARRIHTSIFYGILLFEYSKKIVWMKIAAGPLSQQ